MSFMAQQKVFRPGPFKFLRIFSQNVPHFVLLKRTVLIKTMHFLFLAAQFEFMTRFTAMILYFRLCTVFTAGPNIKWDVLPDL